MSIDFPPAFVHGRWARTAWAAVPVLLGVACTAAHTAGAPRAACAAGLVLAVLGYGSVGDLLSVRHAKRMCDKCLAHLPVDPRGQAHRRRRGLAAWHFLRIVHIRVDRRSGQPTSVAVYLSGLLVFLSCAAASVALMLAPGTGLPVIGAALAAAYLVTAARLDAVHARLRPWCPRCRDEDDDEGGEDAPAPAPVTPTAGVR